MPIGTPKRKKRKPKIKRTDHKQSASFIKAAKELGLDRQASRDAFERAVDALTKQRKKPSSS